MLPRLTQSPGMVKYSTPPIMRILRRGRLLRWSHLLDTARDSVLYTGSDQRMDSLRQLNRNFATRNKPYKKVNCERDMTLAVRFVVHVSCEETLMRKKGKETCQHCIVIPATKNVQLTAAPRKIDWTLLRAKTNNNSTGTRTEDIFDLKEKEVIPMASPIKLVHHLSPSQQHPQGFCEYWLGCLVLRARLDSNNLSSMQRPIWDNWLFTFYQWMSWLRVDKTWRDNFYPESNCFLFY